MEHIRALFDVKTGYIGPKCRHEQEARLGPTLVCRVTYGRARPKVRRELGIGALGGEILAYSIRRIMKLYACKVISKESFTDDSRG